MTKQLWLVALLDLSESLRARWFFLYTLFFVTIVVLLLAFGLTESRVLGFVGLSRLLIVYIQLSIAILPIIILMSTVRSVVGDRESGVTEYLLALPVALSAWYWGKLIGRFIVIFLPTFVAILIAVLWAILRDLPIPWGVFFYYNALLMALAICFLGFGLLISAIAHSADVAQGLALGLWLLLILFIDLIILGLMIRQQFSPDLLIGLALLNPLQVFRTGAMLLFDPQLILLGPTAYIILDHLGHTGYLIWAILYPLSIGIMTAWLGYQRFYRKDLL